MTESKTKDKKIGAAIVTVWVFPNKKEEKSETGYDAKKAKKTLRTDSQA